MARIAVLGAGSWGTALAINATRAGHVVQLWGRDHAHVTAMRQSRTNGRRLPGIALPEQVLPVADAQSAVADADLVIVAVPMQELRGAMSRLPPPDVPLVVAAKGLEISSGLRPSQVLRDVWPAAMVGMLSGPSFAREVALGKPAALVIAFDRLEHAAAVARLLATPTFRPYPSDDLVGVEICGAFKNVVAIAAGIVMGMDLGENARAAAITRGLAELARLAQAQGARAETMMGLAGLGDLVLTASSLTSRNTTLGEALGRGAAISAMIGAGHALAEGAATAAAACALAASCDIELPIADAVRRVVAGETDVASVVEELLSRPLPERE